MGRRRFLGLAVGVAVAGACGPGGRRADREALAAAAEPGNLGRWYFPAEEDPHEATWMAFPSAPTIWGRDLGAVQAVIAEMALAVAAFEPVRMIVRPSARRAAFDLVGGDVELIDGPVDDLWARDTLPLFLLATHQRAAAPLAAGRVRFNGWGGRQRHRGDRKLAALVADRLGVPLVDPGITGEGGGLEVDGAGTALAARSSWVNDNRNPGRTEADLAAVLTDLLGADRLLWVDGLAGADITDGHIDTLARFAGPDRIVRERTAYEAPGEQWYDLAVTTERQLRALVTTDGDPYELVTLTQPATPRGRGPSFLASYVNFYVVNGGVLIPSFGDRRADGAAADVIGALHPGREVIALDIDAVAAGGGGIHCATQQQPARPA